MGLVQKDVIRVKLDLMQIAHFLKGGGLYLNLGSAQIDLACRKKTLEGKSDDELFSELREELRKLRESPVPQMSDIPEVAMQGIVAANKPIEDVP